MSGHADPRARRALLTGLVGALLAGFAAGASAQSAQPATRSDVEAAYLLKFAGYVEWPPQVFAAADSPLLIGTLGADAVAAAAERLSQGRSVRGRKVEVRRLAPDGACAGLHALFLGTVQAPDLDRILQACARLPVLTVSASPQAHARGTMIDLVSVEQNLRFEVALEPVERSGLKLSALLLSAAHRVRGARP